MAKQKPAVMKGLTHFVVRADTNRGKHPNSQLAYERNSVMGQLMFARTVVNGCTGRWHYGKVPVFHRQRNAEIEHLKNQITAQLRKLENELWLAYDHKMSYVSVTQPKKGKAK